MDLEMILDWNPSSFPAEMLHTLRSELKLGPRMHGKEKWLDFEFIHDKLFAYPKQFL